MRDLICDANHAINHCAESFAMGTKKCILRNRNY